MKIIKNNYINYTDKKVSEISEKFKKFEKTLGFRQLTSNEKYISFEILNKISEYMVVYYGEEHISKWKAVEIKSILLYVLPQEILANNVFFESIYIVCLKFFEFLFFNQKETYCKEWLFMLSDIRLELMNSYAKKYIENKSELKFLELGEELGLNMSSPEDVEKFYKLYNKIESNKLNYKYISIYKS